MISLARGVPSSDLIPTRQLAEAARRALETDPFDALSYGDAAGYPPLRAWFGSRLGVEPERVVLANGSLQALGLLAAQLAAGGRRMIVEAPTYDFALRILLRTGVPLSTIPLDRDGLDLEALERVLERAGKSVLYTIPTFHNPTGTTMSEEKRTALLDLATNHDLLVVEDDPYRLLAFDGEPPPTLLSRDRSERVIHLTSLTKTVAPGLRCGAMVLPTGLVEPTVDAARSTYIAPGRFAQATAMAYIDSGCFDPAVNVVRTLLRERRDAALELLAGSRELSWSTPAGGYFLWLELRRAGARDLAARAERAGVQVVPGHQFFADGGSDRHLRVAYSAVGSDEVREGITRVLDLVRRTGKKGGRDRADSGTGASSGGAAAQEDALSVQAPKGPTRSSG